MSKEIDDPTQFLDSLEVPPSPVTVELDWDTYFKEFCNFHGDPIRHRGRLLFPDGWTYSMTDKAGPEWPPPTDPEELRSLLYKYWLVRLRMVKEEYHWLHRMVYDLEEAQRRHSLPLQQVLVSYNEEDGLYHRSVKPLELKDFQEGRLEWLAQDVKDCEAKLRELERKTP